MKNLTNYNFAPQNQGSSSDVSSILSQMTKTIVPSNNLLTEISATPRNPTPFQNPEQQNRHKYSFDIKQLTVPSNIPPLVSPFLDEPPTLSPLVAPINAVPPITKST